MILADTPIPEPVRGAGDRSWPMPIVINRDGGSAAAAGQSLTATIEAACNDAGLAADIRLVAGTEVADAVRAYSDRPLIAVGGGDGTLRSAASTLIDAGAKATLGILPLGTHNHLARQLAIPLDVPTAIDVLARGRAQAIDVGLVNGHVFLNNASIGIYPQLVRSREEEQRRHGVPKWLANVVAAQTVLRRLRHHRLTVETHGHAQTVRTPLLFVGNGVYSLEAGHIGQRAAMDEGKLSLFALPAHSRASALWFAVRTLFGRANPQEDFAALEACAGLTVNAHAPAIHVALDGELHQLRTPLHFENFPAALSIMVPADRDAD